MLDAVITTVISLRIDGEIYCNQCRFTKVGISKLDYEKKSLDRDEDK